MTAREDVLRGLVADYGEEDGTKLARRLGAEIAGEVEAELREEFENDLRRIREEAFDLGVRTAIKLATEQRSISPTAAKTLAPALAAHESRKRLVERMKEPVDRALWAADFEHDPLEWIRDGIVREIATVLP